MRNGITLQVVWWDVNVVKYLVTCSNGHFCGQAEIYANHVDLSKIAAGLIAFPSHPTDSRDVELGEFDPRSAKGGLRMHLYCVDSVGHAMIEVKLRGDACTAFGEMESVALRIPVVAAAIDSFVDEIGKTETTDGATVCLEMAFVGSLF